MMNGMRIQTHTDRHPKKPTINPDWHVEKCVYLYEYFVGFCYRCVYCIYILCVATDWRIYVVHIQHEFIRIIFTRPSWLTVKISASLFCICLQFFSSSLLLLLVLLKLCCLHVRAHVKLYYCTYFIYFRGICWKYLILLVILRSAFFFFFSLF